jgi:putative ABC transport system ATP-binding protein
VIVIRDLLVEYRAGAERLVALEVPQWRVEPGELVALTGQSGSGKSTLLHVVGGLLAPSAGSVRVCGQELSSMGEARRDAFRARHVGVVFQTFNLFPGYSALENVLLGMKFSRRTVDRGEATRVLEEMGLGRRLGHRPSELSVGEQQRVAIARALAKRPELILADEPTASLDPRRGAEVVALLRDACRAHGCTLVMVSHEREVARAFPRTVEFAEINRAGVGEEVRP